MGVYLTIDGITTPVTYGSAANAIQLLSTQFSADAEATKQVIAVSKRVSVSTPQIYGLFTSKTQRSMTLYAFDDDTQETFVIGLGNASITAWMISFEAPASPREFFTIESPQVSLRN